MGHAVVSPPPFLFCYTCDPSLTEEFSIAQNEAIANLVRDGNGAFSGLATVPLQQPDRAVSILSRAIEELGLVGVEIGTNVAGKDLDDSSFEPFWQRAAELNALVFIHPSDVRGVAFDAPYYLRNLIGNPLETSYALARIIFGGVLNRYPTLKVLVSHAGGFLPYTIGRLDRGYQCRRECQSILPDPPSTYLRRLYFDSISHGEPALRYLVELVGADHVALGSDFPFDMGTSTPLACLSGLSESERDYVAFRTARQLIGREP
jgi:aminocarboxymuconate-semialdehyde decarboxylase